MLQLRAHQTWPSNDQAGYDAGQFLDQKEVYGTNGFTDVSPTSPFKAHIEALLRAGVTAGCTATQYCPGQNVTRLQMAIFLERGIHGKRQGVGYQAPSYATPNPFGLTDIDSDPLRVWGLKAYQDDIVTTKSCPPAAQPSFCPGGTVPRGDMARMLLRAKYGKDYSPPPATGTPIFIDVTSGPDRPWIEQLSREGITAGCSGTEYCPNTKVTREQMAIFVARTFRLADVPASPKYFGYYGTVDNVDPQFNPPVSAIAETAAHTNLVFPTAWGNWAGAVPVMVSQIKEARKLGIANAVPGAEYFAYKAPPLNGTRPYAETVTLLRSFFDTLRTEQVLNSVVALYPIDEPGVGVHSNIGNTELEYANGLIRQVAAEYSVIRNVKLAVIYSKGVWPGLHTYDWVGFDDYPAGDSIFNPGGRYESFKSALSQNHRILLVPAGVDGDEWNKVGPTAFLNTLLSDTQAITMIPFVWFDNYAGTTYPGIRSNALRSAYCQAGAQVKGVSSTVCN